MEVTDLHVHRQPTTLLHQHSSSSPPSSSPPMSSSSSVAAAAAGLHRVHPEFLSGSGTGSRAVRERLSAAVTTRQLKRAAAANYTVAACDAKPLDFRFQSSTSSTAASIANSGSIFGLLSIKDERDSSSVISNITTSAAAAVQDQPLDYSRKARASKDISGTVAATAAAVVAITTGNVDTDMKPWKKSRGHRYLVEPHCRTSTSPSQSPPLTSSAVLTNGDVMMSAAANHHPQHQQHAQSHLVQSHQKMAAVRPLQQNHSHGHGHEQLHLQPNEHQVLDYYQNHLPLRLPVPYDMTTMTVTPLSSSPSTDNAYSARSYSEFRRQILNLQHSVGVYGNDDDEGNYGAPLNGRIGFDYDARLQQQQQQHQPEVTRASSNSSCSSSVSPIIRRHRDAATTSGNNVVVVGGGGDSGGVYMSNVHRSASSTSSVEGIVSLTTTPTMTMTATSAPPSTSAVIRRRAGRSLPDEFKDDAYWERRRKNNEAAKRSRDARRAKEDEIAIRAAFLEQENLKLRVEVASLKSETAKLRCLLYNS